MGVVAQRLNGIVVIDKPEGIASYDVVRRLKGLVSGVKVGFLGTLDPLATGVLPILLGEGTKLAPFLEAGRKVYEASLLLGVVTDTQDREGEVVKTVDLAACDVSSSKIEEVIKRFRGKIMQRPPMFSALKLKGVPLYKLARRGEEAERALREVEIYELNVTEIDLPSVSLYIECSKGTYIRTLAHDIGKELGCGAHVTALRRTRSGPFALEDALPLAEVEVLLRQRRLKQHLISLAQAMAFLPAMEVGEAAAREISHGQVLPVEGVHQRRQLEAPQVPSVAQQHLPPDGTPSSAEIILRCGADNQFSIQKRAGHFNKNMVVGMPHSGRGLKEGEVVKVVAKKEGGLVAVAEIRQGDRGLVLRPLRVFHDAFTKRRLYGKKKDSIMVDQGGR
jgi:tRNA pseudouridine55 synthase